MKREDVRKRNGRKPASLDKPDAYELPTEVPFDPAMMKPNRFAGRVRFSHGGKRAGAGRKPAPEPVERHTVTLFKSHADYLRSLDTNLSKAIRALIERTH
jgi:hypothetical protein